MKTHDYALLSHLAALLDAGSVSGAAKRQGLSTPAMSHALSKLRERIGDPLLVRAGVGMVLTPRASQLREELPHALDRVRELLSPPASGRLRMSRPFRIRSSDAVPALLALPLLDALRSSIDGVSLVFVPEGHEDVEDLRSGGVDLDIGVQSDRSSDLMVRGLFTDTMVAVAAKGHEVVRARGGLDAFCRASHVVVSRRGEACGPLDAALEKLGRSRHVAVVVGGYLDAALLAANGALVALLPSRLAQGLALALPLEAFTPPVALPPLRVGLSWHKRMQDDPAHRVLRETVAALVRASVEPPPAGAERPAGGGAPTRLSLIHI